MRSMVAIKRRSAAFQCEQAGRRRQLANVRLEMLRLMRKRDLAQRDGREQKVERLSTQLVLLRGELDTLEAMVVA